MSVAGTERLRPQIVEGLVLGTYVGLSLLLFAPLLPHLTTEVVGDNDALLYVWWMKEFEFAAIHGRDPFVTTLMLFPHPVNAMWNTPMLPMAVLLMPVTAIAGPIASVNVVTIASPAVSAIAAYWMGRQFGGKVWTAGVGGLIYGFGPYVVGQSYGHPVLSFAWFPPVALTLLWRILVSQKGPAWRWGAILGLAAAVQLLAEEEILITSVMLAVLGVVFLGVLHHDQVRDNAAYASRALAVAASTALVLTIWPVAVQLFGPNRPVGPIQPIGRYVTDLTTFVSPNFINRFDPTSLGRLSAHVPLTIEAGGYLGFPLIVLCTALVVFRHRDPVIGFGAVMAVISALLSLGGHLTVNGHRTTLPLPWWPMEHLPSFNSLLPVRLAVYVTLFLSLITSRGLATLPRARLPQVASVIGVCATVVFLWPNRPLLFAETPDQPAFFTTTLVQSIPRFAPVLIAPIPTAGDAEAMLWQEDSDFRFRIFGGYTDPYSLDEPSDAASQALDYIQYGRPVPRAITSTLIADDLHQYRVAAVILGPGTANLPYAIRVFEAAIGRPPVRTGGVTMWLLRGS